MRVTCNVAMSADGKIGPPDRTHASFGSDEDLRRMSLRRREADAIITGGATFRAWPHAMVEMARWFADPVTRAAPPWNVVVTRKLGLPGDAPMFTDRRVRPLVMAPEEARGAAPPVEVVRLPGVTARAILDELGKRGASHVLLESGGGLTGMFFREGLVDELFLTLAPVVLGGAGAPSPVDGPAWPLAVAPRLELVECDVRGHEIFLQYRVRAAPAV